MSAALIKVRRRGEARFRFLTPYENTTALRVHAARFEDKDGVPGEERALRFINDNKAGNPGLEWKVTKA